MSSNTGLLELSKYKTGPYSNFHTLGQALDKDRDIFRKLRACLSDEIHL